MNFNDMVKKQRAKNNGICKTVFKEYPMYAEDYVARDIENRELCIESIPQDALLDYEAIYDKYTGDVKSVYLTPGYDDANYSEIYMDDGEIINTLDLDKKKKIKLNKIKGIITWNDGYLSLYGDVHLSVDEDSLEEQIFGEDRLDEDDVVVTYYPSFY